MFYSTLETYKKSKEYTLIEMLANAHNVSIRRMSAAYYDILRMLDKKTQTQK